MGLTTATEMLEIARAQLQEEMQKQNVPSIEMPQFKPDGSPDANVVASLQNVMATSLDIDTLKELLTDTEKAPFTTFSMGVGKLEDAIKKGDIVRQDAKELDKIQKCIIRISTGQRKLVVKGL